MCSKGCAGSIPVFGTIRQSKVVQNNTETPEKSGVFVFPVVLCVEQDIFPFIGDKPITDIRTPELVNLLERVAVRTLETAHRLKIACDMIFRYAVFKGKSEQNPAANLKGVLPTVKYKHMAAPTEPRAVAEVLRAIDGFSGSFVTKCAYNRTQHILERRKMMQGWADYLDELKAGAKVIPLKRAMGE